MNAPARGRPSLTELVQGLIESRSVPSVLRIGVTGHRVLEDGVKRWVARELDELFSYLAGLGSGAASLRAVSSLAAGADQLFAATALRCGIPLDVVLPFARFAEDFPEGSERDTYERLLSAAASTTCLPWDERSNGAYLAGGLWVADHCDLLIAVWNGKKAVGIGGTGDVVDYSRDAGKPCIHMQTTSLRVEVLA
jgi:hypothetical protein